MIKKISKIAALSIKIFLILSALTAQADESAWKAPVKLESLMLSDDSLQIATKGKEAQVKTFRTENPPKIVLELYDTWIPAALGKVYTPTPGALALGIEKVRLAQFAQTPRQIARVVLDLTRHLEYSLKQEKDAISLLWEKPKTELESSPEARIVQKSQVKDILKELPVQNISVNFQETDIQSALQILMAQLESMTGQKTNVIFAPDVSGNISLRLDDVPFDEVFKLVLANKKLLATQSGGNIIKFMGKASYLEERKEGAVTTRVIPVNYGDAAQIKTTLDAIRSQEGATANILVAKEINSLVITDTEEGFTQITKLLKELDVRPISIAIEAKIVDLKLDNSIDYGIEWQYAKNWDKTQGSDIDKRTIGSVNPIKGSAIGGASGAMPTGGGTGEPATLAPGLPAFITSAISFGRVTNTSFLTARLAAGIKKGKVKLLSNPRIITLNNQAATISVGTQIPIPKTTISQTGTVQDITFTNTGILLNVTPTVNPQRYVRMLITPTVSRPGSIAPGASAPPIDTRTATTVIIAKDGETSVIGGLIDETTDKQLRKVPILGDLPIVGWLFKKQGTATQRTELLVFVTPNILDD